MKRKFLISLIASLFSLTIILTSNAQTTASLDVPRTISYQGLLTSTDGTPLPNGAYDITVTLYTDAGGVHPLWQGSYRSDVQNGIFNLYLGSGNTPLPSSAEMNRPLWVGTSVNGSTEMLPLTPMTASPYALNLPDNAVTTGKLADGAVTAQKVDMDYVAAISVNGEKISSKGTTLDIRGTDGIALNYDQANNVLNVSREKQAGNIGSEKGPQTLALGVGNWTEVVIPAPGTIHDPAGGSSNFNVISGGNGHNIGSAAPIFVDYGTICGGDENTVLADHGTISGGHLNIVDALNGTVAGGEENNIQSPSPWAVISGGHLNSTLESAGGVIGGGGSNTLTSTASGGANYSTIAGGQDHTIDGQYGSIGGGHHNQISNYNGTISGGRENIVSGHTGAIGGGYDNEVRALDGFIGAGTDNLIDANADHSVIAGGEGNTIQPDAFDGTIGGGAGNIIIAAPTSFSGIRSEATIPGGDHLIAQSWAQTVIGGYNIAEGAMPFRYQAASIPLSLLNGPIFIIGNGDGSGAVMPIRSNAFEVSYNGHSTVFDVNRSGGATTPPPAAPRPAIKGGTFTDNTIYGWAEVTANGTISTTCEDFGVKTVQHVIGSGVYRITLNIATIDPAGNPIPAIINCGAVTATIGTGANPPGQIPIAPPTVFCGQIVTTKILNNVFDVYITQANSVSGHCDTPIDLPFKFHVTGRVN